MMDTHTTDDTRSRLSRPPGIFNIELTNRCPMRCVMCPRTRHMTRKQGMMDVALFEKIADELISVNPDYRSGRLVWLHHFGESLLHPEFDRCIIYARGRGLDTGLSINPFMLKGDVPARLLNSAPRVLYVSLDGHDEESFFRIRGMRDGYELSRRRLLEFLKMKTAMRSQVRIILSMIDFSLNAESLRLTREFWESLEGVDAFLPKTFTAWDGSCDDINAMAEGSGREDLSGPITCRFPFDTMTVLWNGDVVPCCFDFNGRYVLGNAGAQSLTEIWNAAPMIELRKEFLADDVANRLCSKCPNLRKPFGAL